MGHHIQKLPSKQPRFKNFFDDVNSVFRIAFCRSLCTGGASWSVQRWQKSFGREAGSASCTIGGRRGRGGRRVDESRRENGGKDRQAPKSASKPRCTIAILCPWK